MGIMEKKMETTGIIGIIVGLYDITVGMYRDNGKENGNYYLGFTVCRL